MKLDELTIGEARQLAEMFAHSTAFTPSAGAWKVGERYFIRTATNYLTGRLVYIDNYELVLEEAAWIADTGRFHQAMVTGKLEEVEPFPKPVIVGRGAIVDATVWGFDLPKVQK